ncbi:MULTISPECIES: hypothetical protein [unclassified Pseudonocardia]|uniref:hypothetical protein n=1 Tax=unclassified Pseudonocardia TaxID=2619320 RepID=UPI0001FFDA5B|nr:hypothetical protein [Pseudonocardia sp. Ae707_Ps1]OLM09088.1 hypothetical protein Ae707Ps1_6035 [Pseudonocardia sp. Ae707_Ps1]
MSGDQEASAPTVRSRALAAGITEEWLQMHFDRAAVLLDGVLVTDLDVPAPVGTSRVNFSGQWPARALLRNGW